jgi:large subunit ribosomal protein L17
MGSFAGHLRDDNFCMRKNIFGRRLKRDKDERKALLKSLISSLILHEKITTTEAKAKAIKGQVDKVVNLARRDLSNKHSLLQAHVVPNAMPKLLSDLATRFNGRTSGYTRLIRLGNRRSDSASMVVMEWVEAQKGAQGETRKGEKTTKEVQKETAESEVKTSEKKEAKKTEKKAPAKAKVEKKPAAKKEAQKKKSK